VCCPPSHTYPQTSLPQTLRHHLAPTCKGCLWVSGRDVSGYVWKGDRRHAGLHACRVHAAPGLGDTDKRHTLLLVVHVVFCLCVTPPSPSQVPCPAQGHHTNRAAPAGECTIVQLLRPHCCCCCCCLDDISCQSASTPTALSLSHACNTTSSALLLPNTNTPCSVCGSSLAPPSSPPPPHTPRVPPSCTG
jgi:hypothetical protein